MKEKIEVSRNPYGSGIQLKTSVGSAMGIPIRYSGLEAELVIDNDWVSITKKVRIFSY